MLRIDVDVENEAQDAVELLGRILSGAEMSSFNEVGGRAANTAAIEYHQEFNESGGWKGNNYLDGPARKTGEFGQNVALGWNFETADKSGATIANNADYYAFKVTGGTIIPKRVGYLTIPMVPEAVGRRVRDYETTTGHRLFRVLGKKALFEKIEGGGIRAVYALTKQSVQSPWPNALPDEEGLTEAFINGWVGALADLIEDA